MNEGKLNLGSVNFGKVNAGTVNLGTYDVVVVLAVVVVQLIPVVPPHVGICGVLLHLGSSAGSSIFAQFDQVQFA